MPNQRAEYAVMSIHQNEAPIVIDDDTAETTVVNHKAKEATLSINRPRIVMVSLFFRDIVLNAYAFLISAIRIRAELDQPRDVADAVQLILQQPPPKAIIVTDEAITVGSTSLVGTALIMYMRNGGTAIFTGLFGIPRQVYHMSQFFEFAGVGWRPKLYHTTTMILNRAVVPAAVADRLPLHYLQRVVSIHHVEPDAL